MNVYIDPKWTFRDLVKHARSLKQEYVFCLGFFSYNYTYEDLKIRNSFIREIKKRVYDLEMEEWKKDKLWEYMNDYENYATLRVISYRLDNPKKK